jgi:methanogenic corrinoid protein MtbC1
MPVGNDVARALGQLIEEMVQALMNFDSPHADQILCEAFSISPFEQVLLELVQPAMVDIGERWHRGEINVAVEHFATQYVRRKLASLLSIFENTARRATVVVGCAPGELHDLGALLSALFLVRRGWHVIYLGPQVPLFDLLETVQSVKPNLVCLSASTMETALGLLPVARGLTEAYPQVHFGYGGRVFNLNPELRHSMPGIFLGRDARELVDTAGQLLSGGTQPASE